MSPGESRSEEEGQAGQTTFEFKPSCLHDDSTENNNNELTPQDEVPPP